MIKIRVIFHPKQNYYWPGIEPLKKFDIKQKSAYISHSLSYFLQVR